ncbi:hypothetical protein IJI17_02225 [Candidatus Saccharibacteria bacterium]|nr:hypothetical protein [Achromobacter sp.]MBQ2649470.1 hypothetical protein [Achromobacter sp.]MBQ3839365.1 hypothetical protein [Fibrobacter sp.]MBQ6321014.1 hypothetical protein [Candidatus Saccharibacteria bacterium]
MAAEIAIALLAFCGTLIGSIMSSQKTVWRIDQLERKVEKHNQVMERVALLEQDGRTQWHTIDELKEELERIKGEQ